MNLMYCKKSDLRKTPRSNLFRLIKQFAESDAECALVQGGAEHYVHPNVGARALNEAIKRYKFAGIKASHNDGEIYLIKE